MAKFNTIKAKTIYDSMQCKCLCNTDMYLQYMDIMSNDMCKTATVCFQTSIMMADSWTGSPLTCHQNSVKPN